MHPLLTLLATQPQLVIEHAQAYAGLFHEEFGQSLVAWQRRTVLQAAALCCLSVAAILGAMAAMFWAATPLLPPHAPWIFWVLPLIPLAIATACAWMAWRQKPTDAFKSIGRQIGADIIMLRAASAP